MLLAQSATCRGFRGRAPEMNSHFASGLGFVGDWRLPPQFREEPSFQGEGRERLTASLQTGFATSEVHPCNRVSVARKVAQTPLARPSAATEIPVAERNERTRNKGRTRNPHGVFTSIFSFVFFCFFRLPVLLASLAASGNACQENKMSRLCSTEGRREHGNWCQR